MGAEPSQSGEMSKSLATLGKSTLCFYTLGWTFQKYWLNNLPAVITNSYIWQSLTESQWACVASSTTNRASISGCRGDERSPGPGGAIPVSWWGSLEHQWTVCLASPEADTKPACTSPSLWGFFMFRSTGTQIIFFLSRSKIQVIENIMEKVNCQTVSPHDRELIHKMMTNLLQTFTAGFLRLIADLSDFKTWQWNPKELLVSFLTHPLHPATFLPRNYTEK